MNSVENYIEFELWLALLVCVVGLIVLALGLLSSEHTYPTVSLLAGYVFGKATTAVSIRRAYRRENARSEPE